MISPETKYGRLNYYNTGQLTEVNKIMTKKNIILLSFRQIIHVFANFYFSIYFIIQLHYTAILQFRTASTVWIQQTVGYL